MLSLCRWTVKERKKKKKKTLNEYPYPTCIVLFLSAATNSWNIIGIKPYPKYTAGDW